MPRHGRPVHVLLLPVTKKIINGFHVLNSEMSVHTVSMAKVSAKEEKNESKV